jgi:hypothetical protein
MDRETQMHPFDAGLIGSLSGHSPPVGNPDELPAPRQGLKGVSINDASVSGLPSGE